MIEPSVAKIAEQLVQRPDAKGLRASKRMSKKKTTSELLGENLLINLIRKIGLLLKDGHHEP